MQGDAFCCQKPVLCVLWQDQSFGTTKEETHIGVMTVSSFLRPKCCKTNRPPSRVRPEFQGRSTTATELISSIFTTSTVHSAASAVSGAGMEPMDAAEPGMADAGRRRDGTSQQRTSADGLNNGPRWSDEGILTSIPSKQPKTVSGLQGSTYGGETAPSGHATSI